MKPFYVFLFFTFLWIGCSTADEKSNVPSKGTQTAEEDFHIIFQTLRGEDIVFYIKTQPMGRSKVAHPDGAFLSQSPWFCLSANGRIIFSKTDSVSNLAYRGQWYEISLSQQEKEDLWWKFYNTGFFGFDIHSIPSISIMGGNVTTIGVETWKSKKSIRFHSLSAYAGRYPENATIEKIVQFVRQLEKFMRYEEATLYIPQAIYLWAIPRWQNETILDFLEPHIKVIPNELRGINLNQYVDYDPYGTSNWKYIVSGPIVEHIITDLAENKLVYTEIDGELHRVLYRPIFNAQSLIECAATRQP